MDQRPALGRAGETLAAEMYRRRGFEICERNYRVSEGEIDLVVRRGSLLVFCEIKTRRTDRWGAHCEAVAWRKQQRLRRLAARWMRERRPGALQLRFDVVSVVLSDGSSKVTHIPDAF